MTRTHVIKDKRGIVIVLALLVVILMAAFLEMNFMQASNETSLVHRQAASTAAFWMAEAGIAKLQSQFGIPSAAFSGTISNPSDTARTYSYSVSAPTLLATNYYSLTSTGTVTSGSTSTSRTISITLKTTPPDENKFKYCVETNAESIDYKEKNVENNENPANLVKVLSSQAFADMFGASKSTIESSATVLDYADLGSDMTVSGMTWVNVPAGEKLNIQHLNGDGILFINGDYKLTGNGTFNGILYVIGTFETATGDPTINGTVFVESNVILDAGGISGSAMISYSETDIAAALSGLSSRTIVSWKEI